MAQTREQQLLRTFGKRMAELRQQRGITQQKLAEATGLSVVAIAYFETGKRWPRLGTLDKISKALKTPTSEFFTSI